MMLMITIKKEHNEGNKIVVILGAIGTTSKKAWKYYLLETLEINRITRIFMLIY